MRLQPDEALAFKERLRDNIRKALALTAIVGAFLALDSSGPGRLERPIEILQPETQSPPQFRGGGWAEYLDAAEARGVDCQPSYVHDPQNTFWHHFNYADRTRDLGLSEGYGPYMLMGEEGGPAEDGLVNLTEGWAVQYNRQADTYSFYTFDTKPRQLDPEGGYHMIVPFVEAEPIAEWSTSQIKPGEQLVFSSNDMTFSFAKSEVNLLYLSIQCNKTEPQQA